MATGCPQGLLRKLIQRNAQNPALRRNSRGGGDLVGSGSGIGRRRRWYPGRFELASDRRARPSPRRQQTRASRGAGHCSRPSKRNPKRAYVIADNKLALDAGWNLVTLCYSLLAIPIMATDVEANFMLSPIRYPSACQFRSPPEFQSTPFSLRNRRRKAPIFTNSS